MSKDVLTIHDHSRYFNNYTYIYPVISRRSEGISIGINLNLNNACNWRCIYCQVEGLQRGKPDSIDVTQLEQELDQMLDWIVNGDFIQRFVPVGMQRLNDICLAGNGEPTLSPNFEEVCRIVVKLYRKYKLEHKVKIILITNGSQIHRPNIQQGIKLFAAQNGEVWFKIDRATNLDIKRINQVDIKLDGVIKRLDIVSSLCKTYIQTCWFNYLGNAPSEQEIVEFLLLLDQVKYKIAGVLLYSTARNPALPEGENITQISPEFLNMFTHRIKSLSLEVRSYL